MKIVFLYLLISLNEYKKRDLKGTVRQYVRKSLFEIKINSSCLGAYNSKRARTSVSSVRSSSLPVHGCFVLTFPSIYLYVRKPSV